ncbi:MAG: hypothetical protein KJ950_05005 [Proteobacteria bacterium]|nr:hypothetical protein [Pseudomonadota bacterium]MBU1687784.1 hypothetical protein [Pseudomonadota bacterium]
MFDLLTNNINMLIRTGFYVFWAWGIYFNGLGLSIAMQALVNALVLADIATWLMYQFYLLPRMMIRFGSETLLNLVIIGLLIREAKSLVPQTIDMQAMAIMIFLSVGSLKGFYYMLSEMDSRYS